MFIVSYEYDLKYYDTSNKRKYQIEDGFLLIHTYIFHFDARQ